ncbi:unnamed protein product [Aphanomyces euteiches]|nr:hypothetical protein AeRB84_019128 [Aphanomyces euteiches]
MGKSPQPNDMMMPTSPKSTAALRFLNTASKQQLMECLQVSDVVADRLVDHRTFGGFTCLDDVVGKKVLRKGEYLAFRDLLLEYSGEAHLLVPISLSGKQLPGAFSERALEKALRSCPRRVDCKRFGRMNF